MAEVHEKPKPATEVAEVKPFAPDFNDVRIADKPSVPKPNDKPNDTTAEGYQTGDAKANSIYKALEPQLQQFDTAAAGVRDAQGKPPTPFKDAAGENGSVVRSFDKGTAAGFSQTFNKDGSVDVKIPEGKLAGFPDVASVKFSADGTATPIGKDGKPIALDATKTTELTAGLDGVFKGVTGDFSANGKNGNWSLDARGNTNVKGVPGIDGSTMSIAPPNSRDAQYTAQVDGAATGDKAGYSTKMFGDPKTGYRVVDYDDSNASKDKKDAPTTSSGKTIEGFIKPPGDRPLQTLVSSNPAGDGSVTTINSDGSADTRFVPAASNNYKISETVNLPGSDNPVASETRYDAKRHPQGVELEQKGFDGTSFSRKRASDGGSEINQSGPRGDIIAKFPPGGDSKTPPTWSRITTADGTVKTNFSADGPDAPRDAKGEKLGIGSMEYKPGAKPGDPPIVKYFGPGNEQTRQPLDPAKIPKELPTISTETTGDKKREVKPDGTTVTTDLKTKYVQTESAGRIDTTWPPPPAEAPKRAELAKMTGLSENDPRLDGVTSFSKGKGAQANITELHYNPKAEGNTDQRSFTAIKKDSSGKEISETRDGIERGKDKRHYVESIDKQAVTKESTPITRSYDLKPGQIQSNQDVISKANKPDGSENPDGKETVLQSRTVNGKEVTVKDIATGRSEVKDYEKGTWKKTEPNGSGGDKVVGEGLLMKGASGQPLYLDKTGNMSEMEIPAGGPRAGDKYKFTRDETGLKTIEIAGADHGKDNPAAKVTLTKGTDGKWAVNPPDAKSIPGFDKAVIKDGKVEGNFTTTAKGDLAYESSDKMTKQVVRTDGGKDTYDLKEYSRIRENPQGVKGEKQYWDGYGSKTNPDDGWRAGTRDAATGKVTFTQDLPGHPASMTRTGDGFEVQFKDGPNGPGANFKIADWKSGKMTMTTGGKTDTLYNTGTVGSDGRQQWAKGTEANGRVTFDDPRVNTGEIPKEAIIKDGKIASIYADGTEAESDINGNTTRLTPGFKGSSPLNRKFGPNGELKSFDQGGRTGTIERTNPVDGTSDWLINQDGKNIRITGAKVVEKPGGQFEIVGKDGSKYESNGRTTGKETIKDPKDANKEITRDVVVDARGQKWTKMSEGTPAAPPAAAVPETWESGGKTFKGEMKKFNNGNVAIKTGEMAETVNPDGSVSKLDKNGVERERADSKDGTYQKRDESGKLVEFKSKNGDVTTLSYDTDQATGQVKGVSKVETKNSAGTVVRTETRDDKSNPPVIKTQDGKTVSYDRMGTRSETTPGANGEATTTVTDVHGATRTVKTMNGRLTEANGPTGSAKLGADAKLKFEKYNAAPDDKTPTEITNGTDKYQRVGGPNSNVYDVKGVKHSLERDGSLKPTEDNSGIDPCFSLQRDGSEPRPGAPGKAGDTTQIDQLIAQRNNVKPEDVQEMRTLAGNLAKAAGLPPEAVSPQILDSIFAAAKDANILPAFSADKLKQMQADLGALMAQHPEAAGMVQALIKDPAQVIEKLDQIAPQLPPSLRPLANKAFATGLMNRLKQPPGPTPQK